MLDKRIIEQVLAEQQLELANLSLKALYSSEVYSKLEDESTKAWNFGPVALYEEFQTERS